MRRGFKTEATDTAAIVRQELGLGPYDRLDPVDLARHVAIPIEPLTSFLAEVPTIAVLLDGEQSSFSAVTVVAGSARMIVVNDRHSPARQANSISHEVAHGLLHHPATPPFDSRGLRIHQSDVEDEADFLAGALLVTEPACLRIVECRTPLASAAAHLGVSVQLIRWRINQTGAVKRIARRTGARF